MILIVGLGNPGEKYINNRHNVGFMFIDYIIKSLTSISVNKKSNNLLIYQYTNCLLAKPQTFMNESGLAVRTLIKQYSIVSNPLIVVHDDLDIPFTKFHIQQGVGPLLHNGIESIENHIHTKEFFRIRIGVDHRTPVLKIPGDKYVLQDFTNDEENILNNEVFLKVFQQFKLFLKNQYNTSLL